jgi:hypothetical protein
LLKRGWPGNPICQLCFLHPESYLHSFSHCSFLLYIWVMVLHKMGISFRTHPRDVADLKQWWVEQIAHRWKKEARYWNAVITLVWWSVSKEQNIRVFTDLHFTSTVVFGKIVEEAAVWLLAGRSIASQLAHRPGEPG